MTVTIDLAELLHYSDHERAKWREWIAADPTRLSIPYQEGGRFPTVGSVLDHIFLVERRHLSLLQGATPPARTGVLDGDWMALFEYAGLVRADLRSFAADLSEADSQQTTAVVTLTGRSVTASKRWLATNLVMHETRHLAQVAQAVRRAGQMPPGDHDMLYCAEAEADAAAEA
jgi:uncharacterized damage-inducible protein DinB